MVSTWWRGPADESIRVSKGGFERGVRVTHPLGGTSLDLAGRRAVAATVTAMTIGQRANLRGVPVDVTCTGRFYDLLDRRGDTWRIVLRHPVYDCDRLPCLSGRTAPWKGSSQPDSPVRHRRGSSAPSPVRLGGWRAQLAVGDLQYSEVGRCETSADGSSSSANVAGGATSPSRGKVRPGRRRDHRAPSPDRHATLRRPGVTADHPG